MSLMQTLGLPRDRGLRPPVPLPELQNSCSPRLNHRFEAPQLSTRPGVAHFGVTGGAVGARAVVVARDLMLFCYRERHGFRYRDWRIRPYAA
jgi:hypothetical protein